MASDMMPSPPLSNGHIGASALSGLAQLVQLLGTALSPAEARAPAVFVFTRLCRPINGLIQNGGLGITKRRLSDFL